MAYSESPSDVTVDLKIGFGQLRGINGLKILNSCTGEELLKAVACR